MGDVTPAAGPPIDSPHPDDRECPICGKTMDRYGNGCECDDG